jgi:creatinine amidohydrolase
MRIATGVLLCLFLFSSAAFPQGRRARSAAKPKGILLEQLTWVDAERILRPETIVVIPLGAAAKEHGPHLTLRNDWIIAEYLKDRVLAAANVVVAPTINYSFYPAFVEYPGSTSLRLETARAVIVDICRSLARFGPRRFYILNTGISTRRALEPAMKELEESGIVMRYTDLIRLTGPVEKEVSKQEGGTHADEIETSMMLYMAPKTVDMRKAVKDYHEGTGPLTRTKGGTGTYSPTGIWGDPTLATREKGRRVTEALVEGILKDISDLDALSLPRSDSPKS